MTDTRRGESSAARPAAAAFMRTDAEIFEAYVDAYLSAPVIPRTVGLRAVYDLGRADRELDLTRELRSRLDECDEREARYRRRVADLENELAILRAGQGAP